MRLQILFVVLLGASRCSKNEATPPCCTSQARHKMLACATGRPGLPSPKLPHMVMQTCCPKGDPTICGRSQTRLLLLHQDATAAYCIAIAWLINHSGDARGAVTAAEGWASQNANGEVQGWLREAAEPGDGPSCLHMIGFVHWGFVHAFRQVLHMLCAVRGLRC